MIKKSKELIRKQKELILRQLNLDASTLGFFAHSKNYLKANLVVKALSLISIPIFTNLLVPASYGILSLFQVASGIIMTIMSVGISSGVYRRFFEKEKDFPDFLGTNLLFLAFFSGIVILIAIIFGQQLSKFFQIPQDLLILASLAAFFLVVLGIYTRLLQAKNLSKTYSKLVILQAIVLLLISVPLMLLLPQETRYMGNIYAIILTGGILFSYATYKLIRESGFNFKIKYIKYSLLFGLPLLPHSFGGYLLSFFDKIIVGQLTTVAEEEVKKIADYITKKSRRQGGCKRGL